VPVLLPPKRYSMTSKKTAASKRAPLPRRSDYSKPFSKDWEDLCDSGRYDMHRLKEAMQLLINNAGPLGPEWEDHPLHGAWVDHRECHIGGDFLLLYQILGKTVLFVRAGTHSGIFKK
jgi:mRNA interferase YafQ